MLLVVDQWYRRSTDKQDNQKAALGLPCSKTCPSEEVTQYVRRRLLLHD